MGLPPVLLKSGRVPLDPNTGGIRLLAPSIGGLGAVFCLTNPIGLLSIWLVMVRYPSGQHTYKSVDYC
jgi:hypothetical protein